MWSQALPIPVPLLPFPPTQAHVEETRTSCLSRCFPFPSHDVTSPSLRAGVPHLQGWAGRFPASRVPLGVCYGAEGEVVISCGAMDDEAGLLKVPS